MVEAPLLDLQVFLLVVLLLDQRSGMLLVALAQVKAWPDQDGTLWRIPQSYYAPIDQQAILLKRGADNTAARDWLAFLQSPDAVAIIQGYGYDTAD